MGIYYLTMIRMIGVSCLLFVKLSAKELLSEQLHPLHEKPMVIIVPSYNNQAYYTMNLDSLVCQQYDNFHIIYIDDCSTDQTYECVKNYIEEHYFHARITLLHNTSRRGAMANLYNAIHACDKHVIILTVDGDDALPHSKVLSTLNKVYDDPNVWITFGQFMFWPPRDFGYCQEIPAEAITNKTIRKESTKVSHLRTFYAGLFQKIKKEDLMYKGEFFVITWDKAMMAPMLEMANGKWKFIPDILYVYNFCNPISDFRIYPTEQFVIADYIFAMPPYEPIQSPF